MGAPCLLRQNILARWRSFPGRPTESAVERDLRLRLHGWRLRDQRDDAAARIVRQYPNAKSKFIVTDWL
jgi:hypothetical protein